MNVPKHFQWILSPLRYTGLRFLLPFIAKGILGGFDTSVIPPIHCFPWRKILYFSLSCSFLLRQIMQISKYFDFWNLLHILHPKQELFMESLKPLPYGVFQLLIETTHGIFKSITRTDLGCRRTSFFSPEGNRLHQPALSHGWGITLSQCPGSCQITDGV